MMPLPNILIFFWFCYLVFKNPLDEEDNSDNNEGNVSYVKSVS